MLGFGLLFSQSDYDFEGSDYSFRVRTIILQDSKTLESREQDPQVSCPRIS